MQKCPHCGVLNSTKRATCYHCEQALAAAADENTQPASRWQAIELPKNSPAGRVLQPAADATIPIALPPTSPARVYPGRRSTAHIRRMAVFYRQFHALVKAGITVASACRELDRSGPLQFRSIAREMAAAAEQGQPISSVLARYPSVVYPWHLGVLRAAETAGVLPDALDQIAHAYEIEWQTRAEISIQVFWRLLLGLPAILLSLPVLKLLSLPIPKDGWTPSLVLATLLYFLKTVSLPIAAALIGLVLLWRILSIAAWFQTFQQWIVLRVPFAGGVARIAALERYLATLSMLLRGGVPLTEATEHAALAAGNAALTPRLLRISKQAQQGLPLVQSLTETGLFDRDTMQLASTGEMTGSLPEMLTRAANYCREQHEMKRRMLLKLFTTIFAVLFLALGGAVFIMMVRAYFDFAFRTYDWMTQ